MCNEFDRKRNEWITCLMNAKFRDKDILINQISKAIVDYEYGYSFVSIKFIVEEDVELYRYKARVPIEMRAFQQFSSPIIFLLHVIDGLVNELEIISTDLSRIEVDKISLEKVEYIIAPEVSI